MAVMAGVLLVFFTGIFQKFPINYKVRKIYWSMNSKYFKNYMSSYYSGIRFKRVLGTC